MVKVVDYKVRKNKEGDAFVTLALQGDLQMVQSKETGRFYATVKKCSVSSTFDEATALSLVGREIPGRIVKVQCEAYEYTIEQTGEVITLNHRWEYSPEEVPVVPLQVVHREVA